MSVKHGKDEELTVYEPQFEDVFVGEIWEFNLIQPTWGTQHRQSSTIDTRRCPILI
jgi:hypothetical protein